MKSRALLPLLLLSLAGCKSVASCRPGTLFVQLSLSGASAAADTLDISVSDGTSTLTAMTPYRGGKTLEIDFPSGRYPAGKKVTLVVVARKMTSELGRATLAGVTLPKSCFAVTVAISGHAADMSVPDLGSTAPVDLAGADLYGVVAAYDLAGVVKKPNGSHCSINDECISTFCVDGYCCVVACAGQCQACDFTGFEGQCMPVTSGQPHGTRGQCLGQDAGACAGACGNGSTTTCTYPGPSTNCAAQSCTGSTKYLPSGCNQGGNCTPQSTFNCAQGCSGNNCLGACTTDTQCANADASKPYCDTGSGNCTPLKPQGHTCGGNSECTSNFCVDGYCCNGACSLQCQTCKGVAGIAPAGTCAVTSGAVVNMNMPPRTACTTNMTDAVCNGSCDGTHTTCQYHDGATACNGGCANGTAWACNSAGNCVSASCPHGCNAGASSCLTSCSSDNQCPSAGECAGSNCCGSRCPEYPSHYTNDSCSPGGACSCTSSGCAGCNGDDGCGTSCDTCTNGVDAVCCPDGSCCHGTTCSASGGCA